MRSEILFLTKFAIVNIIIFAVGSYFLIQNLQFSLSDKTLNNLKQVDVLGAQTSVSQPDLSSELPKHNIPADCWVGYSGKVYDATTVLSLDAELTDYCGKDATELFDLKDKSKRALSSVEARRMLSQFLIQ